MCRAVNGEVLINNLPDLSNLRDVEGEVLWYQQFTKDMIPGEPKWILSEVLKRLYQYLSKEWC